VIDRGRDGGRPIDARHRGGRIGAHIRLGAAVTIVPSCDRSTIGSGLARGSTRREPRLVSVWTCPILLAPRPVQPFRAARDVCQETFICQPRRRRWRLLSCGSVSTAPRTLKNWSLAWHGTRSVQTTDVPFQKFHAHHDRSQVWLVPDPMDHADRTPR
jgi:hypothetical protein